MKNTNPVNDHSKPSPKLTIMRNTAESHSPREEGETRSAVPSCILLKKRLQVMESSSSAWRSLDPPSQVVSCMTCLYKRQVTTTSGGNVPVKDGNGSIWVTPTVDYMMDQSCRGSISAIFATIRFVASFQIAPFGDPTSRPVSG